MKKYEITEENALELFEKWDHIGTYIKDGDDADAELYLIDNTHGVPGVGITNYSRDGETTDFLFDSETGRFVAVNDCYDEEEVRMVCERNDITPGAWYAVHNDEEDNDDGTGSYDIEIAKRILKACLTYNPGAHIAVIDPRDGFCKGKLDAEDLFEE